MWAKQTEGTDGWSEITNILGLYVDDDNNEYVENSTEQWAKARIKILPNGEDQRLREKQGREQFILVSRINHGDVSPGHSPPDKPKNLRFDFGSGS